MGKIFFKNILKIIMVLPLLFFFLISNTYAYTSTTKLTASDAEDGDYFGQSVDIDGNFAIAGAPYDDDNGAKSSGAAYIFENSSGWSQSQKLTASDAEENDYFGYSVGISGTNAIVGAYGEDTGGIATGAAYIFENSGGTWTETAKLMPTGAPQDSDWFGYQLAISGDYAVVGSKYDDDLVSNGGAVYIYYKDEGGIGNWGLQAKFTGSVANDYLGSYVSISGDYAISGSSNGDGKVYVFHRTGGSTWVQESILTPADLSITDGYGLYPMMINGDYVAVSSGEDTNENGIDAGAIYVFHRTGGTTWVEESKILGKCGSSGDNFSRKGIAITSAGDYVMGTDDNYATQVFYNSGSSWTYQGVLNAGDSDNFGSPIGISGNNIILGASGDDTVPSDAGAAYIFDITGSYGTNINSQFPDESFFCCVSKSIGTPGEITTADAAALAILSKNYCPANIMSVGNVIEDISGIENLTSLQSVYLQGHNITDLTPLQGMSTIETLRLSNNLITDLTGLDGLTNVFQIDLHSPGMFDEYRIFRNKITGTGLANANWASMPNLSHLNLSGNAIDDVSSLVPLASSLVDLTLDNNLLTDLTGIESLTNLTTLKLANHDTYVDYLANFNNITDISPLSTLTNLQYLQLQNNSSLGSLAPIAGLDNLLELDLHGCSLTSVEELASGNANLSDFASGLELDLRKNKFHTSPTIFAQAMTDAMAAVPLLSRLYQDISYEDCTNGLDDDKDKDIDGDDIFCAFNSTPGEANYYIDSAAVGGPGCGSELNPCAGYDDLIGNSNIQAVMQQPPYEDIIVNATGTITTSANLITVVAGEELLRKKNFGDDITYTSTGFTFKNWEGNPNPILNKGMLLVGENITIDGLIITGDSDASGIIVMGGRDSTIKNNYIGQNGYGIIIGGGNNITFQNNMFSENRGTVDVDAVMFGMLGISPVPSCGGIGITGSRNTIVVNNSFYNNCNEFDFLDDIFSPVVNYADLSLKIGDIALASIDIVPMSLPENSIVKQNLVFNDLGGGSHGYYYEVSGENINGTAASGILTDSTAADLGSGNNFYEVITNPFTNVGSKDFSLTSPSSYQTCTFAAETPATDALGTIRSDGPLEAGAIESTGGTCAAASSSYQAPACSAIPIKINLPSELDVTLDSSGNPTIELNWQKGEVKDINADRKIDILVNYINRNPEPIIGSDQKLLKNVFLKYLYEEVKKDEELLDKFNDELKLISDREETGVRDVLKSMGIQEIFTDWFPYLAIYNLKSDALSSDIFLSALIESISVIENDRNSLNTFELWRKFTYTFYQEFKNELTVYNQTLQGFEDMQSTLNCIDDELNDYFAHNYNPFVAKAFFGWSSGNQSVIEGVLSGIQSSKKRKITNAIDDIKDEGTLGAILDAIASDSNFLQETETNVSIGFNSVISQWEGNNSMQDLVEFFRKDENFQTLKNLLIATELVSNIEGCIENTYRSEMLAMLNILRFQIIKEAIDNDQGSCNEHISEILNEVFKRMRSKSGTKDEINSLTIQFINDLIQLDNSKKLLSNVDGIDTDTPFLDYYNSRFTEAKDEIIGGMEIIVNRKIGSSVEQIATLDSSATSYTDEEAPTNTSNDAQDYEYYLTTKTHCDQVDGGIGTVKIDPSLEPGTTVEVTLDMNIIVKNAYDELFMSRLKKLFEENSTNEITTVNKCDDVKEQFKKTPVSSIAFQYILECFGEDNEKIKREIAEQKQLIIPPLMRLVVLNEGNTGISKNDLVEAFIGPIVDKIKARIGIEEDIKQNVQSLGLNITELKAKDSIEDLTNAEKEIIKQINEKYFENVSHGANILIEKYNKNGELLEAFNAKSDMFGEIEKNIGEFIAGDSYTVKVRLADENYVLPKIINITVNNGFYSDDKFVANISIERKAPFNKQFRYGDFNEDDVIDLDDIQAWGQLLRDEPGKWGYANIDGLSGIDLLDVVTFQENWGEEAAEDINEISLIKLAEILGIGGVADASGSSSSELQQLIKQTGTLTPPTWLYLLNNYCPTE